MNNLPSCQPFLYVCSWIKFSQTANAGGGCSQDGQKSIWSPGLHLPPECGSFLHLPLEYCSQISFSAEIKNQLGNCEVWLFRNRNESFCTRLVSCALLIFYFRRFRTTSDFRSRDSRLLIRCHVICPLYLTCFSFLFISSFRIFQFYYFSIRSEVSSMSFVV